MSDITTLMMAASGAGGAEETDPNFNQTVLLLHGDGTNGAQNNTFLDSSSNTFTITRNGNTTQGTFSPFSNADGEWSNYFDGSGDYLTTPATGQFAPTGDFTVGHWVYFTSLAAAYQMTVSNYEGNNATDWAIEIQSNGTLSFYTNGATIRIQSSSGAIVANQWHYISFSRSGSTITGYLDGVSVGTYTQSGTFGTATKTIAIGARKNNTEPISGYISNVILIDGSAVTSVPTSPSTAVSGTELLTCQSNRFVDNSSNAFAITVNGNTSVQPFSPFAPSAAYSASVNGGSGYFDGTGDYLTVPAGSAFAPNTGDFTVEGWYYSTSSGNQQIWAQTVSGLDYFVILYEQSNSRFRFIGNGVNAYSTAIVYTSAWNHFAVVRSGTSVTVYCNGIAGTPVTFTDNFSNTAYVPTISGYTHSQTNMMVGFLCDLRYVKGTAVYTSAFTPPTAPLTAISGTELLLNYTNAGIFDNTGKNNLETVGNAQVDTSVVKYGTGSMKFDGTGDCLLFPNDVNTKNSVFFGSGDMTIEAWVYPTDLSTGVPTIVDYRPSSGYGTPAFTLWYNGAVSFFAGAYSGGAPVVQGGSLSLNTWSHVAVCRASGTTRIFVNGTQTATSTNAWNQTYGSTERLGIGAITVGTGNFWFGYIDDLRITKGVARYTSAFTPPTAAFPDL